MNNLITAKTITALEKIEVTKALVESDDFAAQYEALKVTLDQLDSLKKNIDSKIADIIAQMYNKDGTTTVSNGKYNYTYCSATSSLGVDSAKLKEQFPDVYKQCTKISTRKASLRVTEKKD